MKRLIFILLLALVSVSFTSIQKNLDTLEQTSPNGYILVSNDNWEAQTLTIYYHSYNGWEAVGTLHIPGRTSKSFSIGHEAVTNYGYTTSDNDFIIIFYSEQTSIY